MLAFKACLPKCILLPPAMLALKSLQAWCLGSPGFESQVFRRRLDPEGKSLLDICQALRKHGYHYDDIYLLNDNMHLDKHVRDMSDRLTHDALFKLALLTWHFDASPKLPPRELFLFLDQPENQFPELCEILCRRYSAQAGKCVFYRKFARGFANMLGTLEFLFGNEWNLIWQCSP